VRGRMGGWEEIEFNNKVPLLEGVRSGFLNIF